jgi:hypothetical protein
MGSRAELDEAWITEAITSYRQVEWFQHLIDQAFETTEVAVRSPDDLVEVRVGVNGTVHQVTVHGLPSDRSSGELTRAINHALEAAGAGADWARRTLCAHLLAGFVPAASNSSGPASQPARPARR